MTSIAARPNPLGHRIKAIGLVREDVSGPHAPRHAAEAQRHALSLGYQYVYTVRPPADVADPIGYVLALACGLQVDAIVVFDLAQVDNRPSLVCDAGFDLETVCPQNVWTCSAQAVPQAGEGVA